VRLRGVVVIAHEKRRSDAPDTVTRLSIDATHVLPGVTAEEEGETTYPGGWATLREPVRREDVPENIIWSQVSRD